MAKRTFVLVAVVLVAAGFLRFSGLGSRDLWHDEAFTYFCSIDATDSNRTPNYDIYEPPLYTSFMKLWLKATGWSSEAGLRFPSAVFSILSLLVFFRLALYLSGLRTAVACLFLLGFSPMHIWYAQEARGYALYSLEILVGAFFFFKALRQEKFVFWLATSLAMVFALYTNYFAATFILAQCCVLLAVGEYRKKIIPWVFSVFAVFLAYIPQLEGFFKKVFLMRHGLWWLNPPRGASTLATTFKNFFTGYNAPSGQMYPALLFLLLLFFLGARRFLKEKPRDFKAIASLAFVPICLAVLFSFGRVNIYLDRQFIAFTPFFYLILAWGWDALPGKISKVAAFFIYLFLTGSALLNYYSGTAPLEFEENARGYVKKPVRPIAEYVEANYRELDAIAFSCPSVSMSLKYYWRRPGLFPEAFYICPDAGRDYYLMQKRSYGKIRTTERRKFFIDSDDLRQLELIEAPRIWLINCPWGNEDIWPGAEKVEASLGFAGYSRRAFRLLGDCSVVLLEKDR